MTIIIASSIDLEQAGRLVDLAWKEFVSAIGQPYVEQTPELRRAMVWLAWQACKIEREAQEEVRKLAVEEERAACLEIVDGIHVKLEPSAAALCGMLLLDVMMDIRARGEKP
jgi:hypothetical protein